MKVYGLDFTSSPSPKKAITCAECELEGSLLFVRDLASLTTFSRFERFLSREGEWIAGIDFPFGQPREPIEKLGWPRSWDKYVGRVTLLSKEEFEATFREYSKRQVSGKMHPKRLTDRLSNSQSPMKLDFIPVGKMFFQGAPRLLRSGLSIQPCRPAPESRTVIEAYPALVARRFVDRKSYKNDSQDTPERKAARARIVDGIQSLELTNQYGFTVELGDDLAHEFVEDRTGDRLDAVLCAVQAAWAYTKKDEGWSVPPECDRDEGWILDPALLID